MTENEKSLDEMFAVLANRRRRLALYHLIETFDGRANLDALVEVVTNESDEVDVTEASHGMVTTALAHVHLPRLADSGVVKMNDEVVHLRETPARLEGMLTLARQYDSGR
ncbi:DUF7344 domain-containing protein [Haladaptatus sp. NG-SE-30]